jgi:hypothetical protein
VNDSSPEDSVLQVHEQTSSRDIWPQLRQLLIFQFKLYVDALRDLLFSPLSIIAMVLDLLAGNRGDSSYFGKLLALGRRTELAINLFNQHDLDSPATPNIDSLVDKAEQKLRRELEQKKRR